ncbi:hypothetical protein ACOW9W_004017 [Vibrio parahaemolyticus]
MTELFSLLAGVAVPIVGIIFKLFLDAREKRVSRVVNVKDVKGKNFTIIMEGKTDINYISKVLENEYLLEDKVEKIFSEYKRKHSDFSYHKNKVVDFLLEYNDKKIAVEVKSSGSIVHRDYIKYLKDSHPDVTELLFVFDSDIPTDIKNAFVNDKFVKFVSSPRGKALKEKVTNTLNHEFYHPHNKAFKSDS